MAPWLKDHLTTVSSMCCLGFPLGKVIPPLHIHAASAAGQRLAVLDSPRRVWFALAHAPCPTVEDWLLGSKDPGVCFVPGSIQRTVKISLSLRGRSLALQADSLSYEEPLANAKLEMHLVTDTTVKLILSVSIAGITNSHKHSWDLINSVLMVIKFGLLLKKKKNFLKFA